ncbi:DUF192 domain-containing protein [Methyloraptor flagellatus]|uniref:DUF192 domain-containing protein n=1 Tax=Methyloraptor flagellatus TaxID=3162530 RepID=A0AAU7XDV7_9HYPH
MIRPIGFCATLRAAMIAAGLLLSGGTAALVPLAVAPAAAADEARLEIVTATGRYPFRIEIAATPQARATGLMFRKALDADYGMLFDFHREEPASFWMKNTFVSLDMIFIRADGTVANLATGTTPFSEEPVSSAGPVRFVLEVVAGTANKIGLKAGDRIVHPLVAGSK